jgi:hypothetical protein
MHILFTMIYLLQEHNLNPRNYFEQEIILIIFAQATGYKVYMYAKYIQIWFQFKFQPDSNYIQIWFQFKFQPDSNYIQIWFQFKFQPDSNYIQIHSNFDCPKKDLPELKKIEIKYGCEGFQ